MQILVSFRPFSAGGTVVVVVICVASLTAAIVTLRPFVMRSKGATAIASAVGVSIIFIGLFVDTLQVPSGSQASEPSKSIQPSVTISPPNSREPTSSPKATPSGGKQETQSAAFKRCLQQVKALSERSDRPPGKDLSGRVWASSPGATTVVVADRHATWTCNLKPDLAVSGAGKAAIADPEPNDFSLAYFWDEDGMFTWWGGGVLPAAAVTVKFEFPDGNEVNAETNNGYWVMQYQTRTDYNWRSKKRIVVEVNGPVSFGGGGQTTTMKLRWGDQTCNQVNHGC
jgi:hypothetical protein